MLINSLPSTNYCSTLLLTNHNNNNNLSLRGLIPLWRFLKFNPSFHLYWKCSPQCHKPNIVYINCINGHKLIIHFKRCEWLKIYPQKLAVLIQITSQFNCLNVHYLANRGWEAEMLRKLQVSECTVIYKVLMIVHAICRIALTTGEWLHWF